MGSPTIKRLRVLYIVTAFARFEGDVITPWLTETIRRLKKTGVDVEVLVSSYKGSRDHVVYGIKVRRFRYCLAGLETLTHEETVPDRLKRGLKYKLLVLPYIIAGAAGAARLCRKERYDVIHVHWPFPHAIMGYFAKMSARCSMVSTFHGVELRWVKSRMRFFVPFVRWAIKKSDAVTANSNATRDNILSILPKEVAIVPFGTALAVSEPTPIPSGNLILFAGRLVERKGVRYLVDAVKMLSLKMDVRLVIVGDGPEFQSLKEQVKQNGLEERIALAGRVSDKELEHYYQSCSVFVLPAVTDAKGDTEGLGVVLIEALSYGRPVVASRAGGIVDIVKDGETGLLVPEKDPRALAVAIERILRDRNLASKLAEGGLKHVEKSFAWDSIVDTLSNLYARLSGGGLQA
jgi:glycosyltransferase involved in cell wall biosynthesis